MVTLVIFKLHGFLTPVLDYLLPHPAPLPNLIFAWIPFELGIFLKVQIFRNNAGWLVI